ncbi:MAG: hypothetical protein QOI65_1004 [Thermoleophilaceae bacterium]|nr:hypothetical protein [Thermoleophilaceae bacterium]
MTRGRLTAAALVVLAAVAAVVVALSVGGGGGDRKAAEGGPHGFEIAVADDPVFIRRDYYEIEHGYARLRELGVSWLRMNAIWHSVAGRTAALRHPPLRPRYDWTSFDVAIRSAHDHGVQVELHLTGPAPAWATGDGKVGVERPDPRAYAAFVRAAALHFRGRVHRYSIWNEPNFVSWLSPQSEAPRLYRRLYEAGYAEIKRVDPTAQVLIGETAPFRLLGAATAPLRFLRALTCANVAYRPARPCRPLRADGYAHHPYDFLNTPERPYPGADNVTIGSLGRLTGALDRLAAARLLMTPTGRPLPVYLTEFGYFRRGDRVLPPRRRAAYLRRAFAIAERGYPRVRQLLQYLLVSPPPNYRGGRFDTSILLRSGVRTPSFDALSAWARLERLRGRVATPRRP